MQIGLTFLVVGVLIAVIWVVIEVKRLKHKLFAIALIALILFTYLSFTHVMNNNDVELSSPSGALEAGKLYFAWLGSIFGNFKTITANAVNLDWSSVNETEG